MILFRPVNQAELDLIIQDDWKNFHHAWLDSQFFIQF